MGDVLPVIRLDVNEESTTRLATYPWKNILVTLVILVGLGIVLVGENRKNWPHPRRRAEGKTYRMAQKRRVVDLNLR